ncbi:MAG: hypothetical protein GXP49_06365 [Deltaproteobacteria bacterium]|nr:hypothetical protein [Deltaproteobacteria bacterium]
MNTGTSKAGTNWATLSIEAGPGISQAPLVDFEGRHFINLCAESFLCIGPEDPGLFNNRDNITVANRLIKEMKPGCICATVQPDIGRALDSAINSLFHGKPCIILADNAIRSELMGLCAQKAEHLFTFNHLDNADLALRIKELGKNDHESHNSRLLVITEAVFGGDGRIAELTGLADTASANGAAVVVDDTFGFGLLGPHGAGTIRHYSGYENVAAEIGYAGGALGCNIAYTAFFEPGPARQQDHDRADQAPADKHEAALLVSRLEKLSKDAEPIEQVWEATRYLREGLNAFWFDTGDTHSPITPVVIGGLRESLDFAGRLLDMGIIVQVVRSPVLADNKYGLRLTVTAGHDEDQLETAINAFIVVGRKMGMNLPPSR